MSFSFGFSGDDIDDDDESERSADLVQDMSKHSLSEDLKIHPPTIRPQRHTLSELLESTPSQISYNTLRISKLTNTTHPAHPPDNQTPEACPIQRRSLFDIRTQLMAEINPEDDDQSETLLAGLENGDLTSGVYEGGFKTWECALDLASFCLELDFDEAGWDVVELGAGSAIPSLAILQSYLRSRTRSTLRMTLCDYNHDVLRLATAPNILLNFLRQKRIQEFSSSSLFIEASDEGELDVEDLGPSYLGELQQGLEQRGVAFDFFAGGWGDEFVSLLASPVPDLPPLRPRNLMILASETIYSLSSTRVFTDTLMRLLRAHRRSHEGGDAKAWVAAKKVYFGVGGGIDDFRSEVENLGGVVKTIFETSDAGVVRVILEVVALT